MAGGHVNRERQAEHMAAPHRFCDVKIFLANTEPSTHGPSAKWLNYRGLTGCRVEPDMLRTSPNRRD